MQQSEKRVHLALRGGPWVEEDKGRLKQVARTGDWLTLKVPPPGVQGPDLHPWAISQEAFYLLCH